MRKSDIMVEQKATISQVLEEWCFRHQQVLRLSGNGVGLPGDQEVIRFHSPVS